MEYELGLQVGHKTHCSPAPSGKTVFLADTKIKNVKPAQHVSGTCCKYSCDI